MIRLMKVNPVIGIEDMGIEIQKLINKDLAHGFFKDLDFFMGECLKKWNDGKDFKKDKISYKKLIETMELLYDESYNKTAPKFVADKLLEMVSEEGELASEFSRNDDEPLNGEILEAYITFYSKDRDKKFYKTVEEYIHKEALKKFGELSEGYEASATNLLYFMQKKLDEKRIIRKIQEWMSPDENFYIEQ